MTPLVDLERRVHAIAEEYERNLPGIDRCHVVEILDGAGHLVSRPLPPLSELAATAVTHTVENAGWHARTDGAR